MVCNLNKIIEVVLTEQIGAVFVKIIVIFRHCCLLDMRWLWPTQHSLGAPLFIDYLISNVCS